MTRSKLEPVLSGWILSGLMSFAVSGIATWRAIGPAADLLRVWGGAWITAWLFAFPLVLLAAPVTRRLVQSLLGRAGPSGNAASARPPC